VVQYLARPLPIGRLSGLVTFSESKVITNAESYSTEGDVPPGAAVVAEEEDEEEDGDDRIIGVAVGIAWPAGAPVVRALDCNS